MQHYVVHCVISSWTTCHKSACNCECECVSECESIQMTAHMRTHTRKWQMCVCVSDIVSLPELLVGISPLLLVFMLLFGFLLLLLSLVLLFSLFFSLFSVRRINCGRRVICICIAIATAIAFAFMHVDPLRLPSSTSPSPFPFSTPITLSWVKRSLCAVQPRICTFYGHVYGLQLIDYAWAEWTMPEMCKCSNAAHPLPALSLCLHPPPASSLPLSSNWNCMMTAQEALPCPHQQLRLRSQFSCSAYPPGELIADCYSYPPSPPPPPWSKLSPLPADTLWILSALSWHPGFDLPSAFVRAFASATRC